jgi:hypothetical protein
VNTGIVWSSSVVVILFTWLLLSQSLKSSYASFNCDFLRYLPSWNSCWLVYVSRENCGASNITSCAHHQFRHKIVKCWFLVYSCKGLVTLKFILLHLALVVFIITNNQDFISEAFLLNFTTTSVDFYLLPLVSLSQSLFHLNCCLIFIPPSFLELPFLFLSTLLLFLSPHFIYVCIWYSFLHVILRMIWIWIQLWQ